jgi:hypothetical protein
VIQTMTANASTVIDIVVAIRRYSTPSLGEAFFFPLLAITPDYENKPQGKG